MSTKPSPNWSAALDKLVKSGAIPGAVHRVLLWGPPGTGKSYWPSTHWLNCERITIHGQQPPEDLIGTVGLAGKGGATSTVWQDGPAVRAMRRGVPLVLDEIDQHSPDLRCALHAVLDDKAVWGITLPSGERVTPKAGFLVVGTSNESPDSMAAALQSRWDLVVYCAEPHPAALGEFSGGARRMVERSYARSSVCDAWYPSISLRSMAAFHRLLRHGVNDNEAAIAVYGPKLGPEVLSGVALQADKG